MAAGGRCLDELGNGATSSLSAKKLHVVFLCFEQRPRHAFDGDAPLRILHLKFAIVLPFGTLYKVKINRKFKDMYTRIRCGTR
jgi:hypothetical protein